LIATTRAAAPVTSLASSLAAIVGRSRGSASTPSSSADATSIVCSFTAKVPSAIATVLSARSTASDSEGEKLNSDCMAPRRYQNLGSAGSPRNRRPIAVAAARPGHKHPA
jgi:hypothetical protein